MIVWSVQKAAVVESAVQNGAFYPDIYKGNFTHDKDIKLEIKNKKETNIDLRLFKEEEEILTERVQVGDIKGTLEKTANLYEWISDIFWKRNTYLGDKPNNGLGVCYGFAGASEGEIFCWDTIEEFRNYILGHMDVIDSLWNKTLFDPRNVVLKLEVPDDTCPIDINDWQYLMPPFMDWSCYGMSREEIIRHMNIPMHYYLSPHPSGLVQQHFLAIAPEQIKGIGSVFSKDCLVDMNSLSYATILIKELGAKGFNDVELLTL